MVCIRCFRYELQEYQGSSETCASCFQHICIMDCSLCQHVPIASSCLSFLNFWISCVFKNPSLMLAKDRFRTLLIAGVAVSSVTSLGISKRNTHNLHQLVRESVMLMAKLPGFTAGLFIGSSNVGESQNWMASKRHCDTGGWKCVLELFNV